MVDMFGSGVRKKCLRQGHRWMAWSPGSDWWCGRLGCKAKRKAPVMAFIEGALLRSVVDCDGLSSDRDLAEAIGDSTGIGDHVEFTKITEGVIQTDRLSSGFIKWIGPEGEEDG